MTAGALAVAKMETWEDRDAIILDALTRAAERGDRCPKVRELIALIGVTRVSAGPEALDRLARDGFIIVERLGGGPVVTIVATGKSTRRPRDTRPHWLTRNARDAQDGRSEMALPTPSITMVGAHDALLASHIRTEAFKRSQGIADFMTELVARGWNDYVASRAQAGATAGLV